MNKKNRFVSIELLLAILIIVAFFLPWIDAGIVKFTGWEIPNMNRKITNITNTLNIFSKKKDWADQGYVLFIMPFLSSLVIGCWIMMKPKIAQSILLLNGFVGVVFGIYMFFTLPKVGSGVYMLLIVALLSLVYSFIVLKKKRVESKKQSTPISDIQP